MENTWTRKYSKVAQVINQEKSDAKASGSSGKKRLNCDEKFSQLKPFRNEKMTN